MSPPDAGQCPSPCARQPGIQVGERDRSRIHDRPDTYDRIKDEIADIYREKSKDSSPGYLGGVTILFADIMDRSGTILEEVRAAAAALRRDGLVVWTPGRDFLAITDPLWKKWG